jgi:hypothetical protein
MTLRVLDPRQLPEGDALTMAPALKSLSGTVVGMIDNAKIGTARFYDHVADILQKEHGVREFIRKRKPDATRPAPSEIISQLSGADAIVSGIGD